VNAITTQCALPERTEVIDMKMNIS
jgi:hypothetical protein